MRTYAARIVDKEQDEPKQRHDPRTKDGAEALLGQRDAGMWAKQLIARIFRNGMVPFTQSQSHIVTALETLDIVEKVESEFRSTVLRLTDKGLAMAQAKSQK